MRKQCSFCTFQSDDVDTFGEHMRDVHQWDRLSTVRHRVSRRLLWFGFGGLLLAVAILYAIVASSAQSCRDAGSPGCGDNWFVFVLGFVPVAALGYGVGVAIERLVTRLRQPRADATK